MVLVFLQAGVVESAGAGATDVDQVERCGTMPISWCCFSDDASTMYVEEADTSGSATNPWVRIERFLVCQAERMDEVRLAF